MLKKIEILDYESDYTYSPNHATAIINTDEIVQAVQLNPHHTRSSYSITRILFRNGKKIDMVGTPEDLLQ